LADNDYLIAFLSNV